MRKTSRRQRASRLLGTSLSIRGITHLMCADISSEEPLASVEILLEAGADARAKSAEGKSALSG